MNITITETPAIHSKLNRFILIYQWEISGRSFQFVSGSPHPLEDVNKWQEVSRKAAEHACIRDFRKLNVPGPQSISFQPAVSKIYLIKELEALEGRSPHQEIVRAYANFSDAETYLAENPASGFHWNEIQAIPLIQSQDADQSPT